MGRASTIDGLAWIRKRLDTDPLLAAMVEIERRKFVLAETILAAREDAGLTQAQLAERIGTSQPAIARLESANYERVSMTTLKKIAAALGLELVVELRKPEPPKREKTRKRKAVKAEV